MTGIPSSYQVDSIATGSVVAPSLSFGKQGNVNNAYLLQNGVPSDNTGIPIRTDNTEIVFATVANSNNTATFTVEIYEHDGTTYTLLDSFTNTSARSTDYTPSSPIAVTTDKELAIRISGGAATNPVVLLFATGDVPL